MKVYEFLARRSWPRTFSGKILLVSFLGVHVPMFGAAAYALLADSTPFLQQLDVLAAMLVATLLGTAATMGVLHALLAPVRRASEAADGYLRHRTVPRLPTRYTDGAGVLMASVQECITRLDTTLAAAERRHDDLERDHVETFRMLSGLKHDFRTPLTHILGFAEIMRAEAIGPLGSDAYRQYAGRIGTTGQELLTTLQSVIDLSDAQVQAQLTEDSVTLDLAEAAREAIALEHLHAEKRGVQVDIEAPAAVQVRAVPEATRNLLSALSQAAVAGAPENGRVVLTVSARGDCSVRSVGGQLMREDLPRQMSGPVEGTFGSSAGNGANAPESASPMALRLSLIDTLGTALGRHVRVRQTDGDGFEIAVMQAPLDVEMPAAA
ncbi:histidine kinase dimerization/phospho-acceptor domain-containing protein [Tranquillimonas rosea]|uniref:sensor histidine kinase n=1 Tax=Tranquillimonas rosea TaxID=641238 RepID=UPI003BACD78A